MTVNVEIPTGMRNNRGAAQSLWSQLEVHDRLRFVRALRCILAENADALAKVAASACDRPLAEKLVSEVLPLVGACRWLEHAAARVLAPRRHGKREQPFWLHGVDFEVQRQPFGVVLVIGPRNYPLFLPAIHALQALVAGNAVRLKPAPGSRPVALMFGRFAFEAGLDPALLEILDDTAEEARDAIADGVDKVIFTGSSESGREVLAQLSAGNTPSVMELSGEDAVIVLADADLDLVARALRFGLRLNNGNTCIAPRRVIAMESVADNLAARGIPIPIVSVLSEKAAIELANAADFALGASIFSRDIAKAEALAARIKSGFVLINDLIAPTADPRMPFGGVKASGFGSTRGAEGLLEMTFAHVVGVHRGKFHPHFDQPSSGDARFFSAYIRAAYGRRRWPSIIELIRALIARTRTGQTNP